MTLHESVIPLFGVLFSTGLFAVGFMVARRLHSPLVFLLSVAGGIWGARSTIAWTASSANPVQAELLDVTALLFAGVGLVGVLLRVRGWSLARGNHPPGDSSVSEG